MFKHSFVRIAGLTTALFVALAMSAEGALAVVLPDPGVVDGNVSTAAPSSGLEVLGQPWLVALALVVVGIAVVALAITAARRHRRVAHA